MTRLSLLMGLFLSASLTSIVVLLAVINEVSPKAIICRGCITFLVFGALGAVLGSSLEVLSMPSAIKNETEKLKAELKFDSDSIEADLGDLISESEEASEAARLEGGGDNKIIANKKNKLAQKNIEVVS